MAAVLVTVAAAVLFLRPAPTDDPPSQVAAPLVQPPTGLPAEPGMGAPETHRADDAPPAAPVPYVENLVWGNIDLREAREAMPDNLYWRWGAPTSDPEVLAEREQEEKRRNEEYGRVLSGDATEEEVEAYYDYREELSTDYLEFAEWMHERYGDEVSDEMRGLLELSMKLHAARLLQIPTDRERSLAHARERARIRAEWRRQQEEFGELPPR